MVSVPKVAVNVTVNGGAPRLLINESSRRGRWLGVRLRGTVSNTDGIGALVALTAGGRVQVQAVQRSGGYLTSRDPRVLFGLGSAPAAELLEVRWPSGQVDRVLTPPLDAYVVVEEGAGLVAGTRPAGTIP